VAYNPLTKAIMQLAVPRLSAIDAPCRMNNSRVLQGQATSVPWQRVPFHQSSVCWFQPTHFKQIVKCQAGLFMTMMMENRVCLKKYQAAAQKAEELHGWRFADVAVYLQILGPSNVKFDG